MESFFVRINETIYVPLTLMEDGHLWFRASSTVHPIQLTCLPDTYTEDEANYRQCHEKAYYDSLDIEDFTTTFMEDNISFELGFYPSKGPYDVERARDVPSKLHGFGDFSTRDGETWSRNRPEFFEKQQKNLANYFNDYSEMVAYDMGYWKEGESTVRVFQDGIDSYEIVFDPESGETPDLVIAFDKASSAEGHCSLEPKKSECKRYVADTLSNFRLLELGPFAVKRHK